MSGLVYFLFAVVFGYYHGKENSRKMISLPLSKTFHLNCLFGRSSSIAPMIINQKSNQSWMHAIDFSLIYHLPSLWMGTFLPKETIETVSFKNSNISLPSIPFAIMETSTNNDGDSFHGCLALGFKFLNESSSIIHQMKAEGFIDYLSYSFHWTDTRQKVISFGSVPTEITNLPYVGKCKVNSSKVDWSCELSKLIIGNYTYENHFYSYFQGGAPMTYAPENFMMYLADNVFKNDIQAEKCIMTGERMIFTCNYDTDILEKKIQIVFDDYIYSFNFSDFFNDINQRYVFTIYTNKLSNSTWVFGSAFLKYFGSVFDYEREEILLYSNKPIENIAMVHMNDNISFPIKIISSIIIGLLSVSILCLVYLRYILMKTI